LTGFRNVPESAVINLVSELKLGGESGGSYPNRIEEIIMGIEDIWGKKPKVETSFSLGVHQGQYYPRRDIDTWLEKLKNYYEPYDKLLKVEPLMPLDIRSVLAKEGMPILIDEERFNELKDKAERYEKQYGNMTEYAIELENKLEAVKKWKYGILLRMPFIGNQGHISRSDLDELEKILEAED